MIPIRSGSHINRGLESRRMRLRGLSHSFRRRWVVMDLTHNLQNRQGDRERATDIDLLMMKRAIVLAKEAALQGEVPVGAVVYRGSEIVGEGHNLVESLIDPCAHAEVCAIREASERLDSRRLNDYSLAVTLEPCPMCAGAIVMSRIGRLVFGATDPKAGAVETLYEICSDRRLNHRTAIVGGVMANECGRLLSEFFAARRRAKKRTKRNHSHTGGMGCRRAS